jgi:hypothetical protein
MEEEEKEEHTGDSLKHKGGVHFSVRCRSSIRPPLFRSPRVRALLLPIKQWKGKKLPT